MSLTRGLNPNQKAAVLAPNEHLVVAAGAGSGKTTVLTRRVAHLIETERLSPNQIMAVTFTNKAAAELKERLTGTEDKAGLLHPQQGERVWVGTFHSLCRRLISKYGEQAGLVKGMFDIVDTDGAERIITQRRKFMRDMWMLPNGYGYHPELPEHLRVTRTQVDLDLAATGDFNRLYTYDKFHSMSQAEQRDYLNRMNEHYESSYASASTIVGMIGLMKQNRPIDHVAASEYLQFTNDAVRYTAGNRTYTAHDLCSIIPKDEEGVTHLEANHLIYHYQKRLNELNYLDFEDLLDYGIKLLGHEEVGPLIRDQFAAVLVDEFQDTNDKQYEWLMRLANIPTKYGPAMGKGKASLFAVGDINQSIYAFRNANPKLMYQFKKHIAKETIILDTNYRSLPYVLDIANAVIENNPQEERIDIQLKSNKSNPELVKANVDFCSAPKDEAHHIIYGPNGILERRAAGVPFSECAVLYRTNSNSQPLSSALQKAGIPFVVYGGFNFYRREEVRTALAAIKTVMNPSDDISLDRLFNCLRGVGETSLNKLRLYSHSAEFLKRQEHMETKFKPVETLEYLEYEDKKVVSKTPQGLTPEMMDEAVAAKTKNPYSLYSAIVFRHHALLQGRTQYDTPLLKAQASLSRLAMVIAECREFALNFNQIMEEEAPLSTMIGYFVRATGVLKYYQEEDIKTLNKKADAVMAADNIQQLIDYAAVFEKELKLRVAAMTEEERPQIDQYYLLNEFLGQVALETARSELTDTNPDKVVLMTAHSAKGLEFDSVYVAGLMDGVFPHARSFEQLDGEEEERRLFYVALTRAKNHLQFTCPTVIWDHKSASERSTTVSKFIAELPKKSVVFRDCRVKPMYGAQQLPRLPYFTQERHLFGLKDAPKMTTEQANNAYFEKVKAQKEAEQNPEIVLSAQKSGTPKP